MRTAWLYGFVSIALVGALVGACESTEVTPDAGTEDAGDPGCCPDVKTGCTLRRYGKKQSPGDTCIVGFDGVVPDPSAPGWTQVTEADGCPAWRAPKDVPLLTCGTAPPVDSGFIEEDASTTDSATSDAQTNDGGDSGDGASADASDGG